MSHCMSQARNEAVAQEAKKQVAELEALGWYHSLELPDGSILKGFQPIERLRKRLALFPIPTDLRGARVLDVGAWDGWFTFEMERRGADVVAFDFVRNSRFLLARDLLHSRAGYVTGDICRASARELGRFDIVLFLGVLYHLKHPLLGLEKVCELTTNMACVESYVTDDGSEPDAPPMLEFYEGTELRGQFDNWVGPNTSCLLAMARVAGFAEVALENVFEQRAHLTCYRKWRSAAGSAPAPLLMCVENTISRDYDFSSRRDDYVSLWFQSDLPELRPDDVRIEAGPYAARAAQIANTGEKGWHAVCKLPPGLEPGWHAVRIRTSAGQWSNAIRIPVDPTPDQLAEPSALPVSSSLRVAIITDGVSWERNLVRLRPGPSLSIWAEGLPEGCQVGQVSVALNFATLPAVFVSQQIDAQGLIQVNAMLPSGFPPGKAQVRLRYMDAVSEAVEIELRREG